MPLKYFAKGKMAERPIKEYLSGTKAATDLFTLKRLVEYGQIWAGLLKPYSSDYPLIEPRELNPPFEMPLAEYKELPGFSMLALDRPLDYQAEPFQFDLLADPRQAADSRGVRRANLETLLSRLPRRFHAGAQRRLGRLDITSPENYPLVLTRLFEMDRGHVIARTASDGYGLLGLFASFPSDLDREIKRFGQQIGKFRPGQNLLYARNRLFVYRYLMELYGFALSSERHTSAAMFCRRLIERDENFFISVLGTSDRVLTFLSSRGKGHWPLVEKIALVRVDPAEKALVEQLGDKGFFLHRRRRVVILKVTYTQHRYDPENIVEDRALSIVAQEVIHPQTGQSLEVDLLKAERSRLLRFNDIVRGEFHGQIAYKSREIIHGTEDHSSRLKFLQAWLTKSRRHVLNYTPKTFSQVSRTLESYLNNQELEPVFAKNAALHQEVAALARTMEQEYEVLQLARLLEGRGDKGQPKSIADRLLRLLDFISQEEKLIGFQEKVFEKAMFITEKFLTAPYLQSRYLNLAKDPQKANEAKVLKLYRQVVDQKNRLEQLYGNTG